MGLLNRVILGLILDSHGIINSDSNVNATYLIKVFIIPLGSYPCRVISGSVSGVKAQSFVILAMLKTPHGETFHLVQFEGIDNFISLHAQNKPVTVGVQLYGIRVRKGKCRKN